MEVVIIDYNAGNIRSVENALKRLSVEPVITADKQLIRHADKVIFPGVGEAATTMSFLQERGLDVLIKSLTQPVLGICLGMQLMCRYSEEGATNCLGVFDAEVKRFESLRHEDKVPHMGWNTIYNLQNNMKVVDGGMKPGSCLFKGVADNSYVYFVHSYYVPVNDYTVATTDYIQPFSAAIQKDNFFATQFHPEKSGSIGEQILKNFLFEL
ncbi:MAG: imidazole glycerol phosphate synthase subunit HisH [Bacteroidaceae bacterium]|jgi:glutamine amidotransferase|nr:imidazole glycerol phosphate synthase subunit HisH [Bacteroidaceae bacterium]